MEGKSFTLNGKNFEVKEDQAVFLVQRHGKHKANKLTAEGIEAAKNVGLALKQGGVDKFDGVLSSPEPRAVETAIKTMQGLGNSSALIQTDNRLGSLAQTTIAPRTAELVAAAKQKGVGIEQFLLENDDPDVIKALHWAGRCGAEFLRKEAEDRLGQVTLVTSHGAARIEWVLGQLPTGDSDWSPEKPFKLSFSENDCAVVVWHFLNGAYSTDIHFLGQLVPATEPVAVS